MYRLGLTGWPVEHSLSPPIHQAALKAAGLAGEYRLYPAPPGEEGVELVMELLDQMRRGEIHGLNITIPHKQSVIPYLDQLSPVSKATGAVNTILNLDGKLAGDNTDTPGFLADLGRTGVQPPGPALVLGAGGSARAVVYGLTRAGWKVVVTARSVEQALRLSADVALAGNGRLPESWKTSNRTGEKYGITAIKLDPDPVARIAPSCRLIVNCTPLGMFPDIQASPWPAQVPFPPGALVYDLVYNPAETRLVRAAREAGLAAWTGLGMLVEQAALAFEGWTGCQADRPAMVLAARSALITR
jgi:shikimate dehydrogenase